MSEEEIIDYQISAIIGHRPTWKSGTNPHANYFSKFAKNDGSAFDDPFDLFEKDKTSKYERQSKIKKGKISEKAYKLLDFSSLSSKSDIRKKFKEVVKSLHPDTNGGDLSKPWFVPETTSLKEQLNAFLDKKLHMALVVDEYGSIMGLITLEDILEEIVGQIDDEHDLETEEVISQMPNSIDVDGGMSIRDLNRNYGWDIPDTEATTLAGLIIHESQTIPKVGSAYLFYGFKFKILGRTRNQITSLRIEKV